MSRKRADARSSRAAQRRAEAARRSEAAARRERALVGGAPGRRRGGLVALGVAAALVAIGAIAVLALGVGRGRPAGSPAPSASAVAPTAPSAGAGPSISPGGPLAEKLIAVLHAEPFRARIDENTVARSTAGTVTVRLTATVSGTVQGADVSLSTTSSGAGPAVSQDVISVGKTVWIRPAGSAAWSSHPRTDAASAIDGLRRTIRLIDDPAELADAGVETVDGQLLHHLTAVGSIAYRSPDGAEGAYDRLDVWVTDDGVPVLVKGSFSASQDVHSIVGNLTIRYADVGKVVRIEPPKGGPTPIP